MRPTTNEVIQVGHIAIRFLLESAHTNGALAMFEFTVPPSVKMPLPHFHKHFDETIYGVKGILTFTIDGKTVDIAPGESCFVPRGAIHGFNNLTQTEVKALAVITPALLGPSFFKEAAAILNTDSPPDLNKLNAVMEKHGLVAVAPGAR